MPDLVFLSLENWDDVWRRNQFVCAELARRHPESKILFVTPPRDVSNALRRGRLAQLKRVKPWSPERLPNVIVSTPSKYLPNTLALGRWVNASGLRRHVVREMRRLSMQRPLLWINDHATVSLVGELGERSVIYDITDDWISFHQPDSLRERTRRQDEALCRTADATVVCSRRLQEMKASLVPVGRLHLVPNGVDAAHYGAVLDRSLATPAVTHDWPRPVFGYTGTIHPDRIDVDLVYDLARSLDRGSIALIGPNHLPDEAQRRLLATNRVFITGPVPYREIPDYMRAFDVCIVPHRMTPFTESLNPIKLWEYLAAGKPIVSTDVAGFRDYAQHVRLARTTESFTAEIQMALKDDVESRGRRARAEAAKHSWTARVDQIEKIIRSTDAGRDAGSD